MKVFGIFFALGLFSTIAVYGATHKRCFKGHIAIQG